PPGFESSEFPDYVCKLDKALYGLKQAPRACEEEILGAGEEMDDNPYIPSGKPPGKPKNLSGLLILISVHEMYVPSTINSLEEPSQAGSHLGKLKSLSGLLILISFHDLTDKLVEAYMSSFKKSSTTITDLYKGMEVITQLLKDITNSVKDDPAINKKIKEASDTLAMIFTQTTEILSSVRSFDFSTLQSIVKNIQVYAFKQEEASAAWMKSFTNMAWNLGSIISGLERDKSHIKSSVSYLQEDTRSIKSMMTEMYNAFRGQSSSAPSSSVTPTFALTNTLTNVKGDNATHTATKEPHSHTEGETDANIQEKPKEPKQLEDANIEFIGSSTHPPLITQAQPIIIIHPEPFVPQRKRKSIATDDQAEDQRKLVKASNIVCPDPDGLVRVKFVINEKTFYLIEHEIQEY
nr:retrovirus-related Pol polyprotein from transposon TNT 1-94 [Tanacetum cinerariifolium]